MNRWLWKIKKYLHFKRGDYKFIKFGALLGVFIVFSPPEYFSPDNWITSDVKSGPSIKGFAYVIDGDTFEVDNIRIRVWGIDAPEMDTNAGIKAKEFLKTLLSGKRVACYKEDIDKYGRTVAQCFLPDETNIAEALIRNGQAKKY